MKIECTVEELKKMINETSVAVTTDADLKLNAINQLRQTMDIARSREKNSAQQSLKK